MPPDRSKWLMAVVWSAAAVVLGISLWRTRATGPGPLESFASYQDADPPLLMPADGKPEFLVDRLSAWQVAGLPRATRFDEPLGSEHGALTYNAQAFWQMNEARGGNHTGDDFNGIGGMNSDLGDPVFAPADGSVVFAGEPSSGWGKIVVLAHHLPDGRLLQSMHAHLDRIDVAFGAAVARGARIGTVGTANGNYPAHLHFELRESDGVDIGGGYGAQPLNRMDPAKSVAALGGGAPEALAPAPFAVCLTEKVRTPAREIEGTVPASETPAKPSAK